MWTLNSSDWTGTMSRLSTEPRGVHTHMKGSRGNTLLGKSSQTKSSFSWFQSTNNLELRFSQFWIVMTMYPYLWIQNQGQVQNWEVLQYCCAFPSLLRRWGPKSRSWWARKWLGTRQRSPCCAVWVPASLWGSLLCPTDPAFNSPSLKLKKEKFNFQTCLKYIYSTSSEVVQGQVRTYLHKHHS